MLLLAIFFLGMQSPASDRLTLDQCLSLALRNNPQILSSRYDVMESKERITEARADSFPTISFSVGADRLFRPGEQSGNSPDPYSNFSAGLSARYYLFKGFRTASAISAARSSLEAASHQYEGNVQDLILQVNQGYYRLLQAGHLVKVAEKSLESARYHLEFAKSRFEAGLATRSDILKAEVEVSNSNLALIRSRNGRLSLQGALNVLLGQSADAPLEVVDDLQDLQQQEQTDFSTLLALAYEHRPELLKINSQLQAQRSNIRLARSNLLPWVSADANYSFSGSALSSLNKGWSFGLSLSYPVFSGFSLASRVAQEKIAFQAMDKQRSSLEQGIGLDVWNAFLDLKEAKERIENTQIFLENARENLGLAEEEYREGAGSMIEVVDAQTNMVAAEVGLIEAQADFKISLAALDRALGIDLWSKDEGESR
jgi:outer membrane protein TolC